MAEQTINFTITRDTNAEILQQLELMTDYLGYQETVFDDVANDFVPNPETRLQYFRRKTIQMWRRWRNNRLRQLAEQTIVDDDTGFN